MSGGGWRAQNTGSSGTGGSGPSLRTRRGIWLAVTGCVAVAVAILLFPLVFDRVAPVRLVAIGMTSNHPAFPARQAARASAAVFAELHAKDPEQFPSLPDVREAELHGDRLLPGLRDRLAGESNQRLVVYLNCLGGLLAEGDLLVPFGGVSERRRRLVDRELPFDDGDRERSFRRSGDDTAPLPEL